jgi:cellular nucleic acid-binding protein
MKCYACGKLGHISRDCTAPNGGPLSTAGKTCYRCGQAGMFVEISRGVLDIAHVVTGHISRECPQPAEEVIDPSNVNNVVPA